MTKAVIIRTSGTVEPLTLSEADGGYAEIRDAVGGYIDAVRDGSLVGYVHDEGLLIGLPVNVMASALFARPLVGDVVLVGCVSPSGEYDGENYDVHPVFFSQEFADECASMALNETLIQEIEGLAQNALNTSPTVVAVTDEQFDRWLDTGELPAE
jgi:hypothetical protein